MFELNVYKIIKTDWDFVVMQPQKKTTTHDTSIHACLASRMNETQRKPNNPFEALNIFDSEIIIKQLCSI